MDPRTADLVQIYKGESMDPRTADLVGIFEGGLCLKSPTQGHSSDIRLKKA